MSSFKVIYFDARGRAEPTRILLACAGQEFEDVRYNSEQWAEQKAATPMQQLPVLEFEGKKIPQSRAMHGFVARKFDMNGSNNEETTKIDIVLATLEDIMDPLAKIMFYEKDEEKKKKDLEAFYSEKSPKFLKALEMLLKHNNEGKGFFVGDKISRADIVFFVAMEAYCREDLVANYPLLAELKKRVAAEPKIAAYLEKRPITTF